MKIIKTLLTKKITINLVPTDTRKAGATFDLPLAIGILISGRLLKCRINLDGYIIVGELPLNEKLSRVKGMIALWILAKKLNKIIIVPNENRETTDFLGIAFESFGTLNVVCKFINGEEKRTVLLLGQKKMIHPVTNASAFI